MQTTLKQIEPSNTPSSGELLIVQPWDVPAVWHHAYPLLHRAMAHNNGEYDMGHIWKSLIRGEKTLWVIREDNVITYAIVTFLNQYEKKRTLYVLLLAGDGTDKYIEYEQQFVDYAKEYGCQGIEALTIPSVSRLFIQTLPGYRVTHHVLVKDL